MLSVVIIGSGNVAQHLIKAFSVAAEINLIQAYARRPEKLAHLLPPEKITDIISELADADVYIISVSDDAIADVSAQLSFSGRLVVHTSGSTPLEILNSNNRRGVFYPLQTFSLAKEIDFSTVPICLESEFVDDHKTLQIVANAISKSIYNIDSAQRQALHVAAVFVSNFVNHMYVLGSEVSSQNNIPFDILKPLIKEVADKVTSLPPLQAQTGPAVRGDQKTISRHLDFLRNNRQLSDIYTLLTHSIQQTNEQKL